MKFSAAFTFAAAASIVTAQSLSPGCTNALKGVIASPDAGCLNAGALLQFFIGTNQSIPTTVNNWLTGMCAVGTCSNDTLAAVVTNVTAGCSSDISNAGASVPSTAEITTLVEQFYPTVRNILCLKDNSANQLCVTETLNNLESVIGTFSASDLSDIGSIVEKIIGGAKNVACTNCTKAMFALASTSQVSLLTQAVDGVDAICGANFIESGNNLGSDGVSQTAVNEVFSTKTNNALATVFPTTSAVLVALVAAFALL